MEITLQVPELLRQELQRHQTRLVEILERGLQTVVADGEIRYWQSHHHPNYRPVLAFCSASAQLAKAHAARNLTALP